MYDLIQEKEHFITGDFNYKDYFPNERVVGGYDFSNDDLNPLDYQGHGTHVASTAAGNGVLKGVAPDAEIYVYKVFPNAYDSVLIEAIEKSVEVGVDVISMSLGKNCENSYNEDCGPNDALSVAVDNAVDSGVSVVISAGNSGPGESTIGSPGTARKAITIGASYKADILGNFHTDKNPKVDQIAFFSSRGPVSGDEFDIVKPDVVAPGVEICAARFIEKYSGRECLDNAHISISGTSMSAPHVAGAVALIKQAQPTWSPDMINKAIIRTSVDMGENENIQGAGRINVLAAVNYNFPDCENGKDDDNDGFIDLKDSGCRDIYDMSELLDCDNGLDDDNDGFIDLKDRGCENVNDGNEMREFDTSLFNNWIYMDLSEERFEDLYKDFRGEYKNIDVRLRKRPRWDYFGVTRGVWNAGKGPNSPNRNPAGDVRKISFNINEVSKEMCEAEFENRNRNRGGINDNRLYPGETLCVQTREGNMALIGGRWEDIPTDTVLDWDYFEF